MIFILNRFDYNYEQMQRHKINDYLEYPKRLNMKKFTKFNEEDPNNSTKGLPKLTRDYFDFKLSGVVVHNGFASSGHYYSLIKDRERQPGVGHKWLEFNDSLVVPY